MAETTKWEELRKPFDPKVVGKLPRSGVQLDYVGHAAVTDRLLSVDPEWSWEPLATTEAGLPALDTENNLWIRLTVCGVSRIGVGDGRNMKERIGDALRNAAMRFGVALDLWSKDELESHLSRPELKNEKPKAHKLSTSLLAEMKRLTSGWGEQDKANLVMGVLGKAKPESDQDLSRLIEALSTPSADDPLKDLDLGIMA